MQAQNLLGFENRLSLDEKNSLFFLDRVTASDTGEFKVTDILGFPISIVHLEIKRKKGMGKDTIAVPLFLLTFQIELSGY